MIFTSEIPLSDIDTNKKLIFLAGSIDLELPGNWRKQVSSLLEDQFNYFDPTSLNHGEMDHEAWNTHINWELEAMKMADIVFMNLLPNAKSPISLIELGLNSLNGKLVVVCPKEFYKNQYIQALCAYHSTPIFQTLKEGVQHVKNVISVK